MCLITILQSDPELIALPSTSEVLRTKEFLYHNLPLNFDAGECFQNPAAPKKLAIQMLAIQMLAMNKFSSVNVTW